MNQSKQLPYKCSKAFWPHYIITCLYVNCECSKHVNNGVPYLGSTQVTQLTDQYYHKWFVAGIVMRYDADPTECLLCIQRFAGWLRTAVEFSIT